MNSLSTPSKATNVYLILSNQNNALRYFRPMPTSDMSVTSSDFLSALPSIVSAIPKDWYGTTFANLALKSRKPWSEELLKLIQEKKNGITKEDLDGEMGSTARSDSSNPFQSTQNQIISHTLEPSRKTQTQL